jgi:hypothetical protein
MAISQKEFASLLAPVPVLESYPVTLCGRTVGWTDDGRQYLEKAAPFCACLRTIVNADLKEKSYTKKELSEKYNLSSRLFNSAEVFGHGQAAGIRENKALELAQAKVRYNIAIDKYVKGYLNGMTQAQEKNLIARIGRRRRALEKAQDLLEEPRYFPGQDIYEQQHGMDKEEFKKRYSEARNSMIISVGSWDEPPCCNSELQVHFEENEGKTEFWLVHDRKKLCCLNLHESDKAQLIARLKDNGTPYEYAEARREPTQKELLAGKFETEGMRQFVRYQKKICKPFYIPLTVLLLRDAKRPTRWQIRIGWRQPGKEPYAITNTFLGYDINNDSIAYTIFRIQNGSINILKAYEAKFAPKTARGKNRERLLHESLNLMFDDAEEYRALVLGEDLDWEGAKLGDGAISKLLHCIPYKWIRSKIERKGLIRGVPCAFVDPRWTTILGGLLTQLNRDKAAGLMIGIKGSQEGIELLEAVCQKLMTEDLYGDGIAYKVEVKNQFSEIVKIRARCRMEKESPVFRYMLSRILVEVTRHRKSLHYQCCKAKVKKRLSPLVYLDASGRPLDHARWCRDSDGSRPTKPRKPNAQV